MREHPLVLLIDDEEDFLEIASIKLQADGCDTIVTHSVPEALAKAEEMQPDLILSDIYMPPGPNGWEFAMTVRHDPKIANTKFAFFTSLHDPWLELSPSQRATVSSELKDVHFFSKTDDVNRLGEGVLKLIKI